MFWTTKYLIFITCNRLIFCCFVISRVGRQLTERAHCYLKTVSYLKRFKIDKLHIETEPNVYWFFYPSFTISFLETLHAVKEDTVMLFSKDVLLSTNVLLFFPRTQLIIDINVRKALRTTDVLQYMSKHRWSHNIANPPCKFAAGRHRSFCRVRTRHRFSVAVHEKNISLFMKLLFLLLF